MCMNTHSFARLLAMSIAAAFACMLSTAGLYAQEKMTVVDDEDGQPMYFAVVQVGSFRAGTDASGTVVLPASVQGGDTIRVTYVGCESVAITLRALRAQGMIVRMVADPTPLAGVTVEKARSVSRTTVGEYISADRIDVGISTDIAEVLRGIKGVNILTSGGGDVVPSIHGMYGDRLLIVSNGVRQEAQQWSTEFTPKVDLGSSGSIAVVKGAEAVRYGSDALGGVILHESAPLPYGGGRFGGTFQVQYGTNGRTIATQAALEGTLGQHRAWAWRLQTKWFRGGDRSTPYYLLNNTGTVGGDVSAAIGWRGERNGVDVHYSYLDHIGAVFYGAQMGNADLLRERIAIGRPEATQPFSYVLDYPKHNVVHQYVRAKAYHDMGNMGRVDLQLAYQRDRQREYHYRRNYRSNIPSVSLTLNNVQLDAKWRNQYHDHWETEAGLYGMMTDNVNEPGTGVVPLIPNYVERVGALYMIQKYMAERWSAEVGARYDRSYLSAAGIDLYSSEYGGEHRYNNATYNVGLHMDITDELEFKTHFGTAWRAPNVAELYSNGLDLAGGVYLSGDSTMTTERNRKWVTTLTYSTPKLTASLEGYLQWISGYIYQQPMKKPITVISGTYPNFLYRQTAATLHGVDVEVTWNILPTVEYHAHAGMIWAAEQTTGKYLPLIPPFGFGQSIRWVISTFGASWCDAPTVEIEHRYTAQQTRFDPNTDLIETTPPAYNLLGLNLKWGVPLSGHRRIDFYLSAENLLNHEYKEYTNVGRYYSHNLGRDLRLSLKYKF